MAMTSTTNFPDPRVTALETARAMYPGGTVADHIAVAEYLIRATRAPVYPAVDQSPYPWRVTCSTLPPSSGEYVTTNPRLDHRPAEPLIWIVSNAIGLDPSDLSDPDKAALAEKLDRGHLRWQPNPDVPPVWFRVARRGDDDDGTAGVPAKVG